MSIITMQSLHLVKGTVQREFISDFRETASVKHLDIRDHLDCDDFSIPLPRLHKK